VEKTLYNKNGLPTAYITDDYNQDIYLWDGHAVAYVFENEHVYGINGDHLGWFVQEIVFNNYGERVGFTSSTCPVNIAKEPHKTKKHPRAEIRPRWKAPAFPHVTFKMAKQDLSDFLNQGQAVGIRA
jgi:hypothetical protein